MTTTIIKVGGSVMGDKSKPFSFRFDVVKSIASDALQVVKEGCADRLVVIHGGGSYGHYVVEEHGEVLSADAVVQTLWYMRELNMLMVDILMSFGLPVIPFDTHALFSVVGGSIDLHAEPILNALKLGLIPVLYGDVVFAEDGRATILSGDDVALIIASRIPKSRVVFLVDVDGVYIEDSGRTVLARNLSARDVLDGKVKLAYISKKGFDVTGGMKAKIVKISEYVASEQISEVFIVNGLRRGNLYRALCGGEALMTRVIR